MYEVALNILKKLNNLYYEAYIIGGYPRDKYLNIESYDIDICTNAPLDVIKDNFNIIENNSKYGSNVIEQDGYRYEITLYRKDKYIDSRYPEIIFVNTLKEDLNRRDFTINTLCIDKDGNYYDLIDAIKDIDKKIIKCINNNEISINEDPLRILRAIRLSINLNFKLDTKLYTSIKNNGHLLTKLSNNKINNELTKINDKNKLDKLLEELDLNKYLK